MGTWGTSIGKSMRPRAAGPARPISAAPEAETEARCTRDRRVLSLFPVSPHESVASARRDSQCPRPKKFERRIRLRAVGEPGYCGCGEGTLNGRVVFEPAIAKSALRRQLSGLRPLDQIRECGDRLRRDSAHPSDHLAYPQFGRLNRRLKSPQRGHCYRKGKTMTPYQHRSIARFPCCHGSKSI
jgi:hypothetical protein